jgi:DNA-binding CsgD family transcriptional regulator
MPYKFRILLLILFIQPNLSSFSQTGITGQVIIDTSLWKPVAYLSIIPDLDKLFTMSGDFIIDKSPIDKSGSFRFNIGYLSPEDHLYRIHITRKGDPPASLMIGGRNENFILIIANSSSNISIKDTNRVDFIKDALISGYYPNDLLKRINELTSYLDTTTFNGTPIRLELIKSTIYDRLKTIADTCSNSLVSLYAIYQSDFEKDYLVNQQYYKNFIRKWRRDNSAYFVTFRKKIPIIKSIRIKYAILVCLLSIIAGLVIGIKAFKSKKIDKNILYDLSVQERKIFKLLLEGKSNKEISDELKIGQSTVKTHITSIYSKLEINSRKDVLNLNMNNNKT